MLPSQHCRLPYLVMLHIHEPGYEHSRSWKLCSIFNMSEYFPGYSRLSFVQDTDPELDETFLVNVTEVRLLTATIDVQSVPSVRRPGNVATVTIAENDNARGVIEFAQELVGQMLRHSQLRSPQ